jgi:hypothetical protein
MPKLTSGGNTFSADDSTIARVDLSPEDIRQMSKEDLLALLAKLRVDRELGRPPKERSAKSKPQDKPLLDDSDDLEDMG